MKKREEFVRKVAANSRKAILWSWIVLMAVQIASFFISRMVTEHQLAQNPYAALNPYAFSAPIYVSLLIYFAVVTWIGTCKKRVRKYDERDRAAAERAAREDYYRYKKELCRGRKEDAEKFYRACVTEGISDISKESGKQRLFLYAQREGIQGTNSQLIDAYLLGMDVAAGSDKAERIRKLRQEEAEIKDKNRQYLNERGRNKRIRICRDKIAEQERIINACELERSGNAAGASTMMQKEKSWGTAGGIASGIAGPAAGIVAAAGTQQQNMKIREYNQAVAGLAFMMDKQIADREYVAKKEKESWEERLKKVETALVEMLDESELMKYLDISFIEQSLSETGAGRVRLSISYKMPLLIYEDAEAVVDGSIKVLLKDGEKTVGEGLLVFPFEGAGGVFRTEVVCEPKETIPESFTVSFMPNALWAIEKA